MSMQLVNALEFKKELERRRFKYTFLENKIGATIN